MIDTYALSTKLAATKQMILEKMNIDDERIDLSSSKVTIINPLGRVGVQKLILTSTHVPLFQHVKVVFNAQALLTNTLTPELFIPTKENVARLENAVLTVFEELGLTYKDWVLSRIDYAFQFVTPYHSLYPHLISLNPCPATDEQQAWSGSVRRANGNSILNAYSKHQESRVKSYSSSYREAATNLFRFERQCLRPYDLKLKALRNRKRWTDYFSVEVAKEALATFHKHHVKEGDYYSYDSVRQHLRYRLKRQSSFNKAMATLEFIANVGSVEAAQMAIAAGAKNVPKPFSTQHTGRAANELLKAFNDYIRLTLCKTGVNPVLIPKEYQIDYLPNSSMYISS